ncbi:MAG TPA: isoprenylcysteine carboxylmethyltransferase family protein [Bacteroidales bacterium]|nr:isoprenylcysteine carboxylmethyltransferase family protein [Bacteroidales bacterium]
MLKKQQVIKGKVSFIRIKQSFWKFPTFAAAILVFMALVHEFENSGNWLFKRRSWLPVILIAAGLAMMYIGNRQAILFDLRDEMIFLSISLLGEVIRIITVGFAPKNTSGRNTEAGQVADELNVTGIYSIVRHPLYIGNFFMWLGPVLFLRSAWFAVVFCLVYWLYYERIMFAEEQFLRRKFGEAYDKWSEKVGSFIPLSIKYIPSKLFFSIRNVLKREYNSFVNIFVIFFLLDVFRNFYLSERIYFTRIWLILLIAAVLIWAIIRSIHKFTKWLEVEGR